MKTRFLILTAALAGGSALEAQSQQRPEMPPPVTQSGPLSVPAAHPANEMQRVYGPAGLALIAPDLAQSLVDKFRATYGAPKSPRIVIYINRALIDTTQAPPAAPDAKAEKTPANATTTPATSLVDLQTMREIERLFGRVFRSAGVQLVDQPAAVALLSETPGERIAGDKADKQRKALLDVADIAIEVLISSRDLVVPRVSGDQVVRIPDIQTTAIRLKDSAIVGQASASDVIGKGGGVSRLVGTFDVRDITEATALALMQDMLTVSK